MASTIKKGEQLTTNNLLNRWNMCTEGHKHYSIIIIMYEEHSNKGTYIVQVKIIIILE